MLKVCNIDINHSEKVYKQINEFVKILRHKFNIEKIYLYGSLAINELHEGSDIDLIVVGDFVGKIPQRIGEIMKLTDLPIEPLVYTPMEFQKLKKSSSFIKQVIKTGKVL